MEILWKHVRNWIWLLSTELLLTKIIRTDVVAGLSSSCGSFKLIYIILLYAGPKVLRTIHTQAPVSFYKICKSLVSRDHFSLCKSELMSESFKMNQKSKIIFFYNSFIFIFITEIEKLGTQLRPLSSNFDSH